MYHNSRINVFSEMRFLQKAWRPVVLSYSSIKVHINGIHFFQNPKLLIFFGGTFFLKSDFVTFLTLWLSNLMQKNEKKLKNKLWNLALWTYKQTKVRTNKSQIHNTLALVQVSNKLALILYFQDDEKTSSSCNSLLGYWTLTKCIMLIFPHVTESLVLSSNLHLAYLMIL